MQNCTGWCKRRSTDGVKPASRSRTSSGFRMSFEIADLSDGQLAIGAGGRMRIDAIAGGYGWFFDQSPQEDSEFDVPVPGRELQTSSFSLAHEKIDLLTVIVRELGTVYLEGKNRTP